MRENSRRASHRFGRWAAVIGVAGLAAVAAGLVAIVLIDAPREVGDSSPSSSPSSPKPSRSPAETQIQSPSAAPIASDGPPATSSPPAESEPPDATLDLAWTQTASFGTEEGVIEVSDMVETPAGLVVVGTQYDRTLPNLGPPPPHTGRIWTSFDGRAWEDVSPAAIFTNVAFEDVIRSEDGSLIVFGRPSEEDPSGFLDTLDTAAWESTDGRTWRSIPTGFPSGASIGEVDRGARGYLAMVSTDPQQRTFGLWFSEDGRSWEQTYDAGERLLSIDAGDEGFAAAQSSGVAHETPFAVASSDGREWFEQAPRLPPRRWFRRERPIGSRSW